jgi:hypothetical protein
MRTILFSAIILATSLLTGCNNNTLPDINVSKQKPYVSVTPNPWAASELVKTHPLLQQVCDLAGGCNNVLVECERWDNTGNSTLRGDTEWSVTVPGAAWNTPLHALGGGHSFKLQGGSLDRAIEDYLYWYNSEKRQLAIDGTKKETIYPNELPCDKDCL